MTFRIDRRVFLAVVFVLMISFVGSVFDSNITGLATAEDAWDFDNANTVSEYIDVIWLSLGDEVMDFAIAFGVIFATMSMGLGMAFSKSSDSYGSGSQDKNSMTVFAVFGGIAGAYYVNVNNIPFASFIGEYGILISILILALTIGKIILAVKSDEGKNIGATLIASGAAFMLIGIALIYVVEKSAGFGWLIAFVGAIAIILGFIQSYTKAKGGENGNSWWQRGADALTGGGHTPTPTIPQDPEIPPGMPGSGNEEGAPGGDTPATGAGGELNNDKKVVADEKKIESILFKIKKAVEKWDFIHVQTYSNLVDNGLKVLEQDLKKELIDVESWRPRNPKIRSIMLIHIRDALKNVELRRYNFIKRDTLKLALRTLFAKKHSKIDLADEAKLNKLIYELIPRGPNTIHAYLLLMFKIQTAIPTAFGKNKLRKIYPSLIQTRLVALEMLNILIKLENEFDKIMKLKIAYEKKINLDDIRAYRRNTKDKAKEIQIEKAKRMQIIDAVNHLIIIKKLIIKIQTEGLGLNFSVYYIGLRKWFLEMYALIIKEEANEKDITNHLNAMPAKDILAIEKESRILIKKSNAEVSELQEFIKQLRQSANLAKRDGDTDKFKKVNEAIKILIEIERQLSRFVLDEKGILISSLRDEAIQGGKKPTTKTSSIMGQEGLSDSIDSNPNI